jgi:hypothetical protein
MKCGYNKPLSKRPINTYSWVNGTEDYHDPLRRDDVITQASQVGLFQEEHMKEPNFYGFEEHSPVISNIIINQSYLPNFQEAMEGQAVIILDTIDHPDYDMDYELTGELELCERGIITGSDLFSFVKNNVHYFKSFRFDD